MSAVKVSITRASGYDCDRIYAGLEQGIGNIGGIGDLIKPGTRVLVKINHLPPASPAERGIVTHPVFTEAVVRLLKKTGAEITVGDDIESARGFQVSGYDEMCRRSGVALVNLREKGFTDIRLNGRSLKSAHLSTLALEADVIVNLPKMKTHALMVMTGGIKNMYGLIPSGPRIRYHGEYSRRDDFSNMLVDIFAAVRPQITIMDGIIAMEGQGPASGSLREMGLILASRDAVALDTVVARIMGLSLADVGAIKWAVERGLGVGDLNDIEIIGEPLKDVIAPGFKLPAGVTSSLTSRAPEAITRHMMNQYAPRPRILKQHCTACMECVKVCPVEALTESGGKPKIDYNKCIGCMCCHEACRYRAIESRRTMAGNIMHGFISGWEKMMG